jgi:hypothetical protein
MAQNIWVDAFNNSLRKPGRLERYVKDDPDCVNKLGGEKSVTPLAYACFRGHLEVVTLLLTHGARPNVICPHGRTALFFTLTQASPNQLLIIKALLTASDGAADPNEVYPEDGDVNALTLAIEELRDNHIVESLIDAGAKPTPENKKQAKTRKMERSLLPWKEVAGSLVDLAVSAVSLIISYTDGGVLNTVTKGVMKNMYKITNAQNNPVGAVRSILYDYLLCGAYNVFKNIPEPKSPQDFKKNITNFVKNTGLERFFAKKPAFLQALAEKASVLRDDPTTDLGKPENIQRLTSLALYQLVIYCDDSGSMLGDARGYQTHPSNSRYHSLRQLVLRITNVATKLLPDNATVKVRFINDTRNHDVTASGVDAVMESVTPSGFTPLGTSLVEKILQPLVYDKISNPSYEFEQPLLVCTITDGVPSDGDTAPIKKVVADCRKGLVDKKYDPASVMFCISRIGADPGAKTFLDGLRDEKEIQDVVHCTADQLDTKFTELRENERELEVWLLEMLTKPIMRGPSSSP